MNKSLSEDISFGEWVRQRRHILDLTQQELADLVGCARITVRRIESGALKPSKELAQILLEKLGTPTQGEEWLRFARGLSGFPSQTIGSSAKPKSNLPASLTTFISREKELDDIISLITKNRLVTLAGVGGIGKTRLALQVGQKLLNDFPNGVWFIGLESLSDPALITSTVAAAFDIREGSSDQPLAQRLIDYLRAKTTLLILDNCEHLLDTCTQLITTLLTDCQNLQVLVTSREILNMEGEATFYLSPLSLPLQDETFIEKILDYESIQLFAERAVLALSSFRLTPDNMQTTVNICRRVDGIPLAIEMAAARVDILSVHEILRQLNHCFDLLVGKSRSGLPRHQTMRASMDWSWGLLSAEEQRFMRQLSVFAGGWVLESAQEVCEGDTLDLTSALVKKSLISVKQEVGRETRYQFHEIVRQYAYEKLAESGGAEGIRTRHLNYFLGLSEQAEPALKGPTQIKWTARLNDEHDNIRAALKWSERNDVEAGLYLSARLYRFWENVDLREGARWLAGFIENPESKVYPHARAKALHAQGWILTWRQQFAQARLASKECLNLFKTRGDCGGEIDGLLLLGYSSEYQQRTKLYQRALVLAQSLGDKWRQANALKYLGNASSGGEQFVYWEQAIMLFRQCGDRGELVNVLSTFGFHAMLNGDTELAQRKLDEAMRLSDELNDKRASSALLDSLGMMAIRRGDYSQARAYYQNAINNWEELGTRMNMLLCRIQLGYIALRETNVHEALNILTDTVQNFQKDGNEIGVVFTFEAMAELYLTFDEPEIVARLIGWTDATRKKFRDPRPPLEQADVDKVIAACLAKLGEVAFSNAYEEGQKMTIDEAVAYALEET